MAENLDIEALDDEVDIDIVSGSPPPAAPESIPHVEMLNAPEAPKTEELPSTADASTCTYKGKPCSKKCLSGYQFCFKHILEDKSAPYKRCTMIKPESKRRCMTAVPINDPEPALCAYHRTKVAQGTDGQKESQAKEPATSANRPKKRVVRPPPVEIRDSPADKEERERLMSKMVDNSGLMGRVAMIAAPDELDAILEERLHNPSDRKDRIRNLIINMKLKEMRNELLMERSFLFAPIEAVDEIGAMITEARARIPKTEPETIKVEALMGPPREINPAKKTKKIKSSEKTQSESNDAHAQEQKKKTKKTPTGSVETAAEAPPKPRRKTRFDFPSTCTFVGCGEKAVPMTHYCFCHILNEKNQQLYEACSWPDCGYPIPKFSNPAYCAFHNEMHQAATLAASKKSSSIASSTSASTPLLLSSIIANKLAASAPTDPAASAAVEASTKVTPTKKPRKRKAPDATKAGAGGVESSAENPASGEQEKPPKKKRKKTITKEMEPFMGELSFDTPTAAPAVRPISIAPELWSFPPEESPADEVFPQLQLPFGYPLPPSNPSDRRE